MTKICNSLLNSYFYEVRALQMRNGLYSYTILCKRIAFLQAKKKIPARSLGENAHKKKNFILLSNSTKNLHRKGTYGISFLAHCFFFPPLSFYKEKRESKQSRERSNSRWIFLGELCLQKQDVHKYFHGKPAQHLHRSFF